MLRRHAPSLIPVVSALGVVIVAIAVLLAPWHGQAESRGQDSAEPHLRLLDSRLESLETRVSDLASRLEVLESYRLALREPVPPEPATGTAEADTSLVHLAERVSHLEQLQRTRARHVVEDEDPTQPQTPQDRIEGAQQIIRDKKRSDSDKAHAWLDLAAQDVYPWTDDILSDMISIGLNSKDDRAREVVWIGAESEYRSDLLVQPLISALSDPVANIREEAADALSQYLSKPGVQRALLWTSNNDESEEVRNEAARALRGEE